MHEQKLARLEAHLERLIEGAFAHLFTRTVRAQDVALQVARAMQSGALPAMDGDARPIAPDHYIIRVHPDARERLTNLGLVLTQHLVELATEADYRLTGDPSVEFVGDERVQPGHVYVEADHSDKPSHKTAAFDRVQIHVPEYARAPRNPQLIVNGERVFPLSHQVINIGRSRSNQIVLDDPHISRHHAQMRLRFGCYTLFDSSSQSGTFVNDVQVREHRLQSGDVIRLGKTQMVYLEDDPLYDSQTGANLAQDS
jgi:hypothetical protein